jgi:hypothetical protein
MIEMLWTIFRVHFCHYRGEGGRYGGILTAFIPRDGISWRYVLRIKWLKLQLGWVPSCGYFRREAWR